MMVTMILREMNSNGYNNHNQNNYNTQDNAHAHLHVFPPHIFSNPISASSKTLSGNCEIISLILN